MRRERLEFFGLLACALLGLGLGAGLVLLMSAPLSALTRLDHCTDALGFHGLSFLLTLGLLLVALLFTRHFVLVRMLLSAAALGAGLTVPVMIYLTPFLPVLTFGGCTGPELPVSSWEWLPCC